MRLRLVNPPAAKKSRKRLELERSLNSEVARFNDAASQATRVVRDNLALSRWIREYPLESTLLAIASTVILLQTLEKREIRRGSLRA